VQTLLLLLAILQTEQAPSTLLTQARGDRFQIIVPQGWKTLNEGGYVLLAHSSGASVLVQRISRPGNLSNYAQRQAERIMMPLGFAKLGEPLSFRDSHDEWIQYAVEGNRLSTRRRILYRILRRDSAFFEIVYEAPEERFELLVTEAQSIASSVQTLITTPPTRRVRR
jgi:hypothetical protein